MFTEFITEYGPAILDAIVTAIIGYVGIVLKNLYEKYITEKTKKDIIKTVVQSIEQIYKNLHGEEKLKKAIESASEMLAIKDIPVSEFELRVLIESAVGEFNDVFNKNTTSDSENKETN